MKRLHSAVTVAACLGAGLATVQAQQRAGAASVRTDAAKAATMNFMDKPPKLVSRQPRAEVEAGQPSLRGLRGSCAQFIRLHRQRVSLTSPQGRCARWRRQNPITLRMWR